MITTGLIISGYIVIGSVGATVITLSALDVKGVITVNDWVLKGILVAGTIIGFSMCMAKIGAATFLF